MAASIYKQAQLVQLIPDGEWYVAVPHSERPDVLLVDVAKNLTFASEYEVAKVTVVQPVPPFNRFINLRLEFVPGMIEASQFNLLVILLYQTAVDLQEQEPDGPHRLIIRSLSKMLQALGEGLHQVLTAVPAREETPYIEHDFIAHGIQARLTQAGVEDAEDEID